MINDEEEEEMLDTIEQIHKRARVSPVPVPTPPTTRVESPRWLRNDQHKVLRKTHFCLWVVGAFSGSGVGEIALSMALRSLATKGVTFQIMGGIAAEKDPDANRFRAKLLQAVPEHYQDFLGSLRVIPNV